MKKTIRLSALLLCLLVAFSFVIPALSPVSSAVTITAYQQHDQPETVGDYVYYSALRTVKSDTMQDDEIRWVQAAFNYCIEFKGLDAAKVLVSNVFGPTCKATAIRFQSAVNRIASQHADKGLVQLVCDGKVDSATIRALLVVLSDDSIHFKQNVTTAETIAESGFRKQNILQYAVTPYEMQNGDFIAGSWAGYSKNGSYNIEKAGCGIVALVSAVYNLGDTIEKENIGQAITDIFDWAYGKYWYNAALWSLFEASDDQFGEKFGFTVSAQYGAQRRESTDLAPLVEHVKAGGTAVAHVNGHFFTIVAYAQENGNEMLLIFDPAPGKGLATKSKKRRYLTAASGSWISLDVLTNGAVKGIYSPSPVMNLENLEIDAYWLISKKEQTPAQSE